MKTSIKWHGGKTYLAERIVGLMPPRCQNPNAPAPDDPGWLHYVEPFFGGGAVLWAMKPEGINEVVNDIDRHLTNFWLVLGNRGAFEILLRELEATPCCQAVFEHARQTLSTRLDRLDFSDPDVDAARAFFIVNRQSRQALGREFATLAKTRTRRGMNELPSAWLSSIDRLPEAHARLNRVVIFNDDAIKVIKQQDGPRTLFYCDPPYLRATRHNGGGEYKHEMTDQQHAELLDVLAQIEGRFLLSGYRSQLYDDAAATNGWHRHEFILPNSASSRATKERKTECVWTNFTNCTSSIRKPRMSASEPS